MGIKVLVIASIGALAYGGASPVSVGICLVGLVTAAAICLVTEFKA